MPRTTHRAILGVLLALTVVTSMPESSAAAIPQPVETVYQAPLSGPNLGKLAGEALEPVGRFLAALWEETGERLVALAIQAAEPFSHTHSVPAETEPAAAP